MGRMSRPKTTLSSHLIPSSILPSYLISSSIWHMWERDKQEGEQASRGGGISARLTVIRRPWIFMPHSTYIFLLWVSRMVIEPEPDLCMPYLANPKCKGAAGHWATTENDSSSSSWTHSLPGHSRYQGIWYTDKSAPDLTLWWSNPTSSLFDPN